MKQGRREKDNVRTRIPIIIYSNNTKQQKKKSELHKIPHVNKYL